MDKSGFFTASLNTSQTVMMFLALFLPLLLYGFFEWQVFFATSGLILASSASALLLPALMAYAFRRRKRFNAQGWSTPQMTLTHWFGAAAGLVACVFQWTLVMLFVSLAFPVYQSDSKVFQVKSVTACTWKCRCKTELELNAWPAFPSSKLCADYLSKPVVPGEFVQVSGIYAPYAVFVSSIELQ